MAATAASEKRIIAWIEDMIDEQLASSTDLSVALKDGIALCKLVNKIRAGSVPYINTNPGVLNHLENISAYLQACWTLGVPTDAIFGTQDLHQRRNIESVIKNLDSLAAVTVTSNEFVIDIIDETQPFGFKDSDSSFTTGTESQAPTATRDEVPTVTREESATVTQNTSSSPSDTKTSQAYNEELQAENEELQEENESLRRRLRKLQTIIEENEANIVDKDKEIQELTEKLDQSTKKLKEFEEKKPETPVLKQSAGDVSDLEKKDERIAQLEDELQEQKRAFIDLVTRFAALEEENNKLKEQQQIQLQHSDSDSSMSSRSSSASSINGNSQTGLRVISPREDRRKARQEGGSERRKKRESSGYTLADVLEKKEGIEREREKEKEKEHRHKRENSSTTLTDALPRKDGSLRKKERRHKRENSSAAVNDSLDQSGGIEREKEKEKRRHERENSNGGGSELGSHRAASANASPPLVATRQPKEKEKAEDSNKYAARRSASEEVVKSAAPSEENTPKTPRKRNETPEPPDSRNSSPKEEKRKNGLAGRLRGIRERIGSMRSNKDERPNTASDLTSLVRNIFNAPSTVTFQDVVKVNFKKDTSRRLFSLILDQHMGSFTLKSHELTSHAFDMLLYLVNASLLAMGDETETDTIALQVLMRSAFFFYKKEKGGDKQFMQLHVRSYDVWKRFEFWEEYFYSEVGIHAKTRKDDPKLVYDVLSEFVLRMKDFGVGGGLVQKLVNDVSAKDLLTQDELASLLKSANPSAPPTPTAINSPNTVPVMMRHNFSQKSIRKPAFCDFCSEFIWGVSKVVFSCNDCKYTIHRKCLDECLPHAPCSAKRSFGTPFAVSHNVSVTRSANGGIEGLPKEWQDLLEQSGIGKEDALANPHTMLHILEYHTAQAKKNTTKLIPTRGTQRSRKANPHPPVPSFNQNQNQNPPPSSSSSSHIDTPRENGAEAPPPLDDDEPETPSSSTKVDDILNTGDPNTLYSDMTQIGQGANAQVFLGVNSKTNEKVAIKKIQWDPAKSQALINEIQIMKSIKHKNVINCSECFLLQDELWVTMEYIDFGSLTEIIDLYERGTMLSEAEIAYICYNTLKALENVHSLGVIHRDVKTDNILLGADGRVLLADFGSAAKLSADRPNRKTVIGSPYWMAPELIRGEEYTQKVDIFSFGCMLRELATGDPPFADLPPLKALFLLATSDVPSLKNVEGKKWSGAFLDFCNKCVRKDPAVRPGASDLLLHPFLGMACTQEEFANNVIAPAAAAREKQNSASSLPIFGI